MAEKYKNNPYGVSPNIGSGAEIAQNKGANGVYKNNTLAIISLVLGILSIMFYFLTAIPGIITGHMARSKANRMPEQYEGKGMALAGLILSYIMLLISIIVIASMAYAFLEIPGFKDTFMESFKEGLSAGQ